METVAYTIRQMQTLAGQVFLPDTTLIADSCMDYRPETGELNDWTRIGKAPAFCLAWPGSDHGTCDRSAGKRGNPGIRRRFLAWLQPRRVLLRTVCVFGSHEVHMIRVKAVPLLLC